MHGIKRTYHKENHQEKEMFLLCSQNEKVEKYFRFSGNSDECVGPIHSLNA